MTVSALPGKTPRLIVALLLAGVFAACSVEGDKANLRVVELIDSQSPTDAYLDDNKVTTGQGYQAVGPFTKVDVGEQSLSLRSSDGTSNLLTETVELAIDSYSAAVLAGTPSSPELYLVNENPPRPFKSRSRLQVLNTVDQGPTYDVFITGEAVDIATVSPTIANTASTKNSDAIDFDAGTYRLRITTGTNRKLVYDSGTPASVTFGGAKAGSLVIYAGASADLVNAVMLTTSSNDSAAATVTTLANVRLVNAADSAQTVNLLDGAATLFAGLPTSTASSYQTISASTTSFSLQNNASPATNYGSFDLPLTPGEDHTILATGTDPNLTLTVLEDDNRPPQSGSSNLRVINGVSGGGNADVFVNFRGDFPGIAERTASASYIEYPPSPAYNFGVSLANGAGLVDFGTSEIAADGVYTFLLSGAVAAPLGKLIVER